MKVVPNILIAAMLVVVVALHQASAACNVNNTGSVFTRGASPYGTGASFILGRAASYAALASSTVTSTGNSVLTGDIGTSPGTSITGFGPGTFTGAKHAADTASLLAQNDLIDAYNLLANLPCNVDLSGTNLGGLVLAPGVYAFAGSAALSNVALTLEGTRSPNDAWVFQITSTLTTDSSSSIVLTNGSRSSNVFWQVGSSATLGQDSAFVGSILAYASVSVNVAVSVDGRALALNGAVTLINNAVTVPTGESFGCTSLIPVLLNSSSPFNASATSFNVTCGSSSCPVNSTQFAGMPVFAGAGAGNAKCDSVSAITANGFTCQLGGEFSSTGGDLFLIVNTITTEGDKTCFGESAATFVATIPAEPSASSGSALSSVALSLMTALTAHLL